MTATDSKTLPPLSVVVPVCDEAGAVEAFLHELLDVAGSRYALDVVVVDDGSRDGTDALVATLAAEDDRLRLIMRHIHQACVETAARFEAPGNYVLGANVAGFLKVADAMLDQGVV